MWSGDSLGPLLTLTWDTNLASCLDWELCRADRLRQSDLEKRLDTDLALFSLGELLYTELESSSPSEVFLSPSSLATTAEEADRRFSSFSPESELESELSSAGFFSPSTWKSFFLTNGSWKLETEL